MADDSCDCGIGEAPRQVRTVIARSAATKQSIQRLAATSARRRQAASRLLRCAPPATR
jgi:hypothetical protein